MHGDVTNLVVGQGREGDAGDGDVFGERRDLAVAARDEENDGERGAIPAEDAAEEVEARRVGAVHVVEDAEDGPARSERAGLPREGFEQERERLLDAALEAVGAVLLDEVVPAEAEEEVDDGRLGDELAAPGILERGGEGADLGRGLQRVDHGRAGREKDAAEESHPGAVRRGGGRVRAHDEGLPRVVGVDAPQELVHEARLADAGAPCHEAEVQAAARARLGVEAFERGAFGVAADEGAILGESGAGLARALGLGGAENLVRLARARAALHGDRPEVPLREPAAEQIERLAADHDGVERRRALEHLREVDALARQHGVTAARDEAGVDADPHGEARSRSLRGSR